jgi:hypothetical protein
MCSLGTKARRRGAKGHMENKVDVKLAMGLGFRVFFLSALDPVHLYEKKMNETQTQILGCIMHALVTQ